MQLYLLNKQEELIKEINNLSFFEEFLDDEELMFSDPILLSEKYKEKIAYRMNSFNLHTQECLKHSNEAYTRYILAEAFEFISKLNDTAMDIICPIEMILGSITEGKK
jgi:hypothetical protein